MKNNLFETTDLALAGAIYLNYPLEALDKRNPAKVVFLFAREDGLDELVELFWKRALKVEPIQYFNSLKTIKSRIYEK